MLHSRHPVVPLGERQDVFCRAFVGHVPSQLQTACFALIGCTSYRKELIKAFRAFLIARDKILLGSLMRARVFVVGGRRFLHHWLKEVSTPKPIKAVRVKEDA